jgi:hypothetical protein
MNLADLQKLLRTVSPLPIVYCPPEDVHKIEGWWLPVVVVPHAWLDPGVWIMVDQTNARVVDYGCDRPPST